VSCYRCWPPPSRRVSCFRSGSLKPASGLGLSVSELQNAPRSFKPARASRSVLRRRPATDLNGGAGPLSPEQGARIPVRMATLPAEAPAGTFAAAGENGELVDAAW